MALKPGNTVPLLELPTVDRGRFVLSTRQPEKFTMIAVYRGLHCPICKTYLRDLDHKLDDFAKLGVEAVAVSTDDRERAEQSRANWGIERLTIAYGLSIELAREWGLYISKAVTPAEPSLFAEPGLFLIRPNFTLYCASVQTMPFTRPPLADLLKAISFIGTKNYPARGEV